MSININGFAEIPFRDAPPQSVAVRNCVPLTRQPGAVPVDITWANYVPAGLNPVAIRIPLNINVGVQVPLERIVAVYVDNSSNDYPVFVNFPDTQYGISVSANSIQWFPVITNAFNVNFASSFVPNFVGRTRFIFSSIHVDPVEVSQLLQVSPEWLQTSQQSTATATIIGEDRRAPALGDRLYNQNFTLSATGTTSNILLNPDVNDPDIITYIKEIDIKVYASRATPYPYRYNFRLNLANGNAGPQNDLLRNQIGMIDTLLPAQAVQIRNADISFTGGLDFINVLIAGGTGTYGVPVFALVYIVYTMRGRN